LSARENPENTVADEQQPPPISVSTQEYFVGKPGEFAQDLKNVGVSPRRFFFQVGIVAPSVALLGNLFGCTSVLLGNLPSDVVARSKIDTYYPVRGTDGSMTKRFIADDGAYDFTLPASWLEDQALVLAKARRFEGQQVFVGDGTQWPTPKQQPQQKRRESNIPDAAFGPAERSRGDGMENVSVVRSRLEPGFSLRGTLGEPVEAARALLANVIAAPGSGRTAELLAAGQETRGAREEHNGGLVYTLEYLLTRADGRIVHNLAVVASLNSELLTLTVVCPEDEFARKEKSLRQLAGSFRLL
jgi:hypothetical protein